MTINTISPATFTTSILIGDPTYTNNAGHDSVPLMTMVGGKPVSAAIEIQSTDAALLLSRMTAVQMNAIPNPTNGMLIYNTTANQMYSYTSGTWIPVAGGGTGNVTGPGVSVAGDIAVFADTTGKVIADSGININNAILLSEELLADPPAGLAISNLTYLQFAAAQDVGLIFVGTLMPVEFITNDFGPGSQVCSLFTGDLPSSSTTPSALLELQSTTGAMLISRMTTAERDALTAPAAGMMIFNTTPIPGVFNFYDGTTWVTFAEGSGVPPVTQDFQILSSGTGTPIWYSTYIDTGNPLFNLLIGTNVEDLTISGQYNVAVGYASGTSLTTGGNNSAFGKGTLNALTTGSFNNAHGVNALHDEISGARNNAFGFSALAAQNGASDNTAFGSSAGLNLSTGGTNSIFGSLALSDETTGSENCAFGYKSLLNQDGVSGNSAFGYFAGTSLTSGAQTAAFGFNALSTETTGGSNSAFGYQALYNQNLSSNNAAFGYAAGAIHAAYTNCTFLGYGADASVNSLSNATAIGYNASVGQSNSLILGNGANVGIGTSTPNTSSILELASTTGALLLPRLTDVQRNALTAAAGMLIYDTTTPALEYWNGSAWIVLQNSTIGAALTRTNDTNVTLTLGGTPTTALLEATSITAGWTGELSLARGGTNANLTASNGGIFYSTATAGAILAGTATANQIILSGASTTPSWSSATYPSSTTVNQLLYSSSSNVIAGLATVDSAVLVTTSAGVPGFSGTMLNGQLIIGSTGATPTAATLTPGIGISISNGAGSITISATSEGNWVDQNTGSVTLAAGYKYMIDNGAGLVTLTLPAAPTLGDTFEIAGYSSGGWQVAQNALQNMQFGSTSTTPGVTGYAASMNQYDRILITYAAANTFVCAVLQSTGGITIH